jgi:hypothetical protein
LVKLFKLGSIVGKGYVKKGNWGGRRPGAGARRGVPRARKDRAESVAQALATLSDPDRQAVATALGGQDVVDLARQRAIDLLRDPTMAGAGALLEALRLVLTPPAGRRAAPVAPAPGPQRRSFTVVAAK